MAHGNSMASIMVRDVSPETHKKLRVWCINNSTSLNQLMQELIAQFVRDTVDKPEKRK